MYNTPIIKNLSIALSEEVSKLNGSIVLNIAVAALTKVTVTCLAVVDWPKPILVLAKSTIKC